MEIFLTLAVNSSFSPHLSHSFFFFHFCGLFTSRQPGLGWQELSSGTPGSEGRCCLSTAP